MTEITYTKHEQDDTIVQLVARKKVKTLNDKYGYLIMPKDSIGETSLVVYCKDAKDYLGVMVELVEKLKLELLKQAVEDEKKDAA